MATSIDVSFCRTVLAAALAEVKEKHPEVILKDAWVWKCGKDHWEFHFGEYYWHGSASNAYEARSKGWDAWMASKVIRCDSCLKDRAEVAWEGGIDGAAAPICCEVEGLS